MLFKLVDSFEIIVGNTYIIEDNQMLIQGMSFYNKNAVYSYESEVFRAKQFLTIPVVCSCDIKTEKSMGNV